MNLIVYILSSTIQLKMTFPHRYWTQEKLLLNVNTCHNRRRWLFLDTIGSSMALQRLQLYQQTNQTAENHFTYQKVSRLTEFIKGVKANKVYLDIGIAWHPIFSCETWLLNQALLPMVVLTTCSRSDLFNAKPESHNIVIDVSGIKLYYSFGDSRRIPRLDF